jgi:hypothetical protein
VLCERVRVRETALQAGQGASSSTSRAFEFLPVAIAHVSLLFVHERASLEFLEMETKIKLPNA